MPRAFGFDGDSAYYESLEKKVLADEQKRLETEAEAVKERRRSLGLPDNEKMSRKDKKVINDASGRKKSFGEKAANLLFNGGRRSKLEGRQRNQVGNGNGQLNERYASTQPSAELDSAFAERHGTPEIVR